jgi:cytochrome c oxidase accessory protein FixG
MTGISGFYYWIFAFFREQVCTMVCPYGRIQGVLLDSRSITVSYDYKRGEPRGARNKGDCIDCRQCIAVCPTGIDIRNGTQLECVNCTACIDECNLVMQKVQKEPDLIRFDSAAGIETGKKALFNPRTYAYSAVLAILLVVLAFTVNRRKDIDISILRVPGALYQEIDSLTLSNIYNTKILNKSDRERELESRLLYPEEGSLQYAVPEIQIAPNGTYQSVLIVKIPKNILIGKSTGIKIGTFENGELIESTGINFIGPTKTSE